MINALFELLGTFYRSGDYTHAEWIARSIMQTVPDDIVAIQLLGLVYYRTSRRAEAFRILEAIDRDPTAAPATDELQPLASEQCLRAATGEGSPLATAWYDLGLLQFRLGHFQRALDAFHAAVSARPNFYAARVAIARIAKLSARRRRGAPADRAQQRPASALSWSPALET